MELKNYTLYWCYKMIDRLIHIGIDHFFIAPGSRSTPIISAIVRHEKAKIFQHIDERSLAFMALGYGKRTRKPGVIVVTSGTAVANLMPAVVEAQAAFVPMLVVSADRPYELRDTGANQTIEQTHIFSSCVVKSYDLASPCEEVSIKKSHAIFDQAVSYCLGARSGPVHINIQLREPLHNGSDGRIWLEEEGLTHRLSIGQTYCDHRTIFETLLRESQGLLVVGELHPGTAQDKIVELAEKLNWPIFAEITSNLRHREHPLILHHFDVAMNNPHFVNALKPRVVIHFGDRIVSKRYWAFVEKNKDIRFVRLSEHDATIDQTGHMEHLWTGNSIRYLDDMLAITPRDVFNNHKLIEIYDAIKNALVSFLENADNNEAYFAAQLVACLCEPVNLFISSSMPIRDLDQFSGCSSFALDVFSNRGASGIDGVISTAVGVAIGSHKPTILLIGDVAFLHDTNGLMALKNTLAPMLIIVINNSGGGIFHFLPIAAEPEIVTPLLDTPHDVHIKDLCKAHGVEHRIAHAQDFSSAIRDFFSTKKTQVIEIPIKRELNVALRRQFYRDIGDTAHL